MAELFVVILGLKGFVDVDVELFVVIMNFIYIAYSVFFPHEAAPPSHCHIGMTLFMLCRIFPRIETILPHSGTN